MLFNSYEFIFIFLPVTLFGFFIIARGGYREGSIAWLVAASLFYYGWWNPIYLILIIASILINYSIGAVLGRVEESRQNSLLGGKKLLVIGIVFNLGLLGYFKYANFFVDSLSYVSGNSYHLEKIILPLAISFFTFQQVAYLVDAYRGEAREYNFLHYCLFVCFFPQLIAGPIVHHKEMLPQFSAAATYKPQLENIAIGLSVFFLGLFKKVVLADSLSLYVEPVFAPASAEELDLIQSWKGSLAYTFQLYFDFSGYSDMAIGVARMFGIKLPTNFNSPYKSKSIIDFWRRWHITLSTFLKDYLYISIGGNRTGNRHVNVMLTMLLGGLWHGAGWTFVMWGGLHGLYLVINHFYRSMLTSLGITISSRNILYRAVAQLLTFVSVVFGWVYFRATDFTAANAIIKSMLGVNGMGSVVPSRDLMPFMLIGVSFLIVWILPNAQEYMYRFKLSLKEVEINEKRTMWSSIIYFDYSRKSVAIISALILVSLLVMQSVQKSAFLYYDF